MTEESLEEQLSYEMVSVRPATPPPGTEGSNWHRYVIAFGGRNSIKGCRRGDFNVVTGAVEEIVAQLNQRHKGRHGRVHLVMTPKKVPTVKDQSNLS
jgi:hypothetical protein